MSHTDSRNPTVTLGASSLTTMSSLISSLGSLVSVTRIKASGGLAPLLIVTASFLFGLVLRLRWLAKFGSWLESNTLDLLPFYRAVKQLARGLIGVTNHDAFRGGLLNIGNDIQEMVYIIEELGDGRIVVLRPFAPASFTGSVSIVANNLVTPLQVSAGEVSKVIAHWGVGTAETLGIETKT